VSSDRVLEVDGWITDENFDEVADAIDNEPIVGLIVKGSQGVGWTNPRAVEMIGELRGRETLTGWLHYCEPGLNEPTDEAATILAATDSLDLPLGVWVEIDDLGGKAAHELTPWLATLAEALTVPGRPLCAVLGVSLLEQAVSVPSGVHLVLVGTSDTLSAVPWARRVPVGTEGEFRPCSAAYALVSTRGINPVGEPVAAPVAAPAAPSVPVAGDTAVGGTPPADGSATPV
jgi:hypothetical protein